MGKLYSVKAIVSKVIMQTDREEIFATKIVAT